MNLGRLLFIGGLGIGLILALVTLMVIGLMVMTPIGLTRPLIGRLRVHLMPFIITPIKTTTQATKFSKPLKAY